MSYVLPAAEELWALLDYDPLSGMLTWKPRADPINGWNNRYAGKIAGAVKRISNNPAVFYRFVTMNDRKLKASRIIWKMMTGSDPASEIDHIDTDTLNDRWSNLRSATKQQNTRNRKGWGKTGLPKGVLRTKYGKYQASICVDHKKIYLGTFERETDAALAYDAAAEKIFGEFARLNTASPPRGRAFLLPA